MRASYEDLLRGRVDERAVPKLARYGELLESWGAAHSLVRFAGPEDLVERHLLESVAYRPEEPEGLLVDVGSGRACPAFRCCVHCPDGGGCWWNPGRNGGRFCGGSFATWNWRRRSSGCGIRNSN
jgi:16S rRNA G527 N7-methylase RsmG